MKQKRPVTIVVPVYGDWPSLKDCIASLRRHVKQQHKVMLVNDVGPDADLIEKNVLRDIRGVDNFFYFRNPKNLGFVQNCNRAVFELDKTDNDILLLNSDTKVTSGFLEEMYKVLYSEDNIGAVSPRSNNANNCTIPLAAFISGKGIKPRKSYSLFLKYKEKFPRHHVMPTAHGFCILIRRSLIQEYGLFDEVFGKGYGEEVDFCQRIGEHGWLSSLCNRAFVYHLGAKSFSLETKAKIQETSVKIVRERWPKFKAAITVDIENSLLAERKIMGKDAGEEMPYGLSQTKVALKRLIRRSPYIYRLAKSVNRRLRR
jgi:GT2 family glycosyltransferase